MHIPPHTKEIPPLKRRCKDCFWCMAIGTERCYTLYCFAKGFPKSPAALTIPRPFCKRYSYRPKDGSPSEQNDQGCLVVWEGGCGASAVARCKDGTRPLVMCKDCTCSVPVGWTNERVYCLSHCRLVPANGFCKLRRVEE